MPKRGDTTRYKLLGGASVRGGGGLSDACRAKKRVRGGWVGQANNIRGGGLKTKKTKKGGGSVEGRTKLAIESPKQGSGRRGPERSKKVGGVEIVQKN